MCTRARVRVYICLSMLYNIQYNIRYLLPSIYLYGFVHVCRFICVTFTLTKNGVAEFMREICFLRVASTLYSMHKSSPRYYSEMNATWLAFSVDHPSVSNGTVNYIVYQGNWQKSTRRKRHDSVEHLTVSAATMLLYSFNTKNSLYPTLVDPHRISQRQNNAHLRTLNKVAHHFISILLYCRRCMQLSNCVTLRVRKKDWASRSSR